MKSKESSQIAVIGIGCLYPGAKSPLELWENILGRRQQFREMPEVRLPSSEYYDSDPNTPDKTYQNKASVIDDYSFNWQEKRIPKRSYESTDIVHWLALDTALKAIEDAGYSKDKLPKENTGVIIGNTLTGEFTRSNQMPLRWPYVKKVLKASLEHKGLSRHFDELENIMETYYKSVFHPMTEDSLAGGLANTISGRVCNFLDLHGGGYIVDGACSSSLLAICTAANHLELGQMDLAIAGGVDVSLDTFELIGFAKTGALTRDEMRVYDKAGKGFLPGEGCGVVVLKRLEDARRDNDQVYAIINGWGISSDGKGGITAPSGIGQATALKRAYNKANFDPELLSFIEGHGTGTTVGDKTELEGISIALNQEKTLQAKSCGVTSFKSIVGHTKAAAGIGAFIKTTIALNQRILPPTAGLKEPNPIFTDIAKSLYPIIHGEIRNPEETLYAGVSAMGFGGINSHIILQSGDSPSPKFKTSIDESKLLVSNQNSEVFFLAADGHDDLLEKVEKLISLSKGCSYAEMADLAFHNNNSLDLNQTLRAAIVAKTPFELGEKLENLKKELNEIHLTDFASFDNDSIVFGAAIKDLQIGALFPGQGSQRLNMAFKLIQRFDWAKEFVDYASKIFEEEGVFGVQESIFRFSEKAQDILEENLWKEELKQTDIAQPAIVLASLLWLKYLNKIGINLSAGTGHSLGELTSFYASNLIDEETVLRFAAFRGKTMANCGSGSMASLFCSKEKANDYIQRTTGYVTIANINALEQTVVSGDADSIKHIIKLAELDKISAIELPVSAAFHSDLIADASEAINNFSPLAHKHNTATGFKLISSVTGHEVAEHISLNEYFSKQSISRVNFVEATLTLVQNCDVIVEIGPGKVLSGLSNSIQNEVKAFPVEAKAEDDLSFNTMLANLFVRGANFNIKEIYSERLIRPFKAASQKQFFVNPLERPFPAELLAQKPTFIEDSSLDIPAPTEPVLGFTIPYVDLKQYFSERGEFIKDIILADLKHLKPEADLLPPSRSNLSKPQISKVVSLQIDSQKESLQPALIKNEESEASKKVGIGTIQTISLKEQKSQGSALEIKEAVYNLISEKTGFPADQLNDSMRLLDDLNMDSIKAGSFLGELLRRYDLQEKIDPSSRANGSLGEIIGVITEWVVKEGPKEAPTTYYELQSPQNGQVYSNNHSKENVLVSTDTDKKVEKIVLSLIAEKTGFPEADIELNFRLLDDLNLDSIKAGSILAQLAKEFNLQSQFEASQFANATLEEIIKAIEKANEDMPLPSPKQTETSVDKVSSLLTKTSNLLVKEETNFAKGWVKSFYAHVLHQELASTENLPSKTKSTALIRSGSNPAAIAQMSETFSKWSDEVITINPQELSKEAISSIDRLIVFLPEIIDEFEAVKDTIETLSKIASLTAQQNIEIAFIQTGDGHFSRRVLDADSNKQKNSFISAVAFAASLHLENPSKKYRVLEFDPETTLESVAKTIAIEFESNEKFVASGYDSLGKRNVIVYDLPSTQTEEINTLNFNKDDVILVTGGGKGITAECALAFAEKYKCKMALVGSSQPNQEIQQTLNKYSNKGLTAEYFACNIVDKDSVEELIQKIKSSIGSISGVIHGAGMNKPRRAEIVSANEALQEISPKLLGAWNLVESLKEENLKCFIALTSIIGITGMPGNSWYAFSNESLDLLLRNLQKETGTATITIAYSVWSEVGMGHRMGSTKVLANMGIGSISPEEGITEFLKSIEKHNVEDQQVVIAARLGGLDTWKRPHYEFPETNRYLEEILYFEPGVELIAQSKLSHNDDLYLNDHNFNGSLLFPTVFGLEAMTQAAAYLTGNLNPSSVKFENITLLRPIAVPEKEGLKIQIKAIAELIDGQNKVFVGISTEDSGFTRDHFTAEIIFNFSHNESPQLELNLPDEPLPIEAKTDLYSWLLFQGPMFQNIDKVYVLNSDTAIFSVSKFDSDSSEKCFAKSIVKPFFLRSPLLRDLLLQSGQLILTKDVWLPLKINNWEVFKIPTTTNTIVECKLTKQDGKQAFADVRFIDAMGNLIEKITDYEIRALKATPHHPSPSQLADSDFYTKNFYDSLSNYTDSNKENLQVVFYKHHEVFNSLSREQRHEIEEKILTSEMQKIDKSFSSKIIWDENGKPSLENSDLDLSISHSQTYLMMTLGKHPQGCDIELVEERSRDEWINLLGSPFADILEEVEKEDKDLDIAGTRLWCVKEAFFKAYGQLPQKINFLYIQENKMFFNCQNSLNENFQIVTLLNKTHSNVYFVFALFINLKTDSISPQFNIEQSSFNSNAVFFDSSTNKFVYKFKTSFKDCKGFQGRTDLTNIPQWMGQLREYILMPIEDQLMSNLSSNEYGMVTNESNVKMYQDTTALNTIIGTVWASEKTNFENSYIDLMFEWFIEDKKTKQLTKFADSNLSTTWVKIESHGIVKKEPLPEYFTDYMNKFIKDTRQTQAIHSQYLSEGDYGQLLFKTKNLLKTSLKLSSRNYETGLSNSNSVGNLYYSNYYDWQFQNIEQFISSILPEIFQHKFQETQFISFFAEVKHLQEAMPFETVQVDMYLDELFENGFSLFFEYFSISGDSRRKLAYGSNKIIWCKRELGSLIINSIPTKLCNYLLQKISDSNHANLISANL